MRWQQGQPQGRLRKPCEGHTISVVDHVVYVLFGKHEDDHGNPICPPMQLLDTDSMTLSSPSVEPGPDGRQNVPEDREGHTASVVGKQIFIFGGTWTDEDDNTIYMNDLHILDTTQLRWRRPSTSGVAPIEREGHTAAPVGTRVFIFGGTWVDDEETSIYLNDLFVLDVESMAWAQTETTGTPPMQREGHTASVVGTQMVVFGGAGLDHEQHSVNLNDLHILDTETLVWHQPTCAGSVPQERRYHSACVIDQQILVFGGQYYDASADLHFECDNALCVHNLEAGEWSMLPVDSSTPLRRACHAAGVVGKKIFLIGGRYWDVAEDDYIFLNDIQILDTRAASTLAVDWRAFINNEHLSDITITVGGRTVFAHRVVLAARCAYFRGLFESGMRDATSHSIALDDISYPVFMVLLEYLYTDTFEMSDDALALPLFAAADFLGVEQLKAMCIARIEADLSVENVCGALTAADKHLAPNLKETCVDFIVANFQEVLPTEGFKDLPRPLLDLVHLGISARHYGGGAARSGGSAAAAQLSQRVSRLSMSPNSPNARRSA